MLLDGNSVPEARQCASRLVEGQRTRWGTPVLVRRFGGMDPGLGSLAKRPKQRGHTMSELVRLNGHVIPPTVSHALDATGSQELGFRLARIGVLGPDGNLETGV